MTEPPQRNSMAANPLSESIKTLKLTKQTSTIPKKKFNCFLKKTEFKIILPEANFLWHFGLDKDELYHKR